MADALPQKGYNEKESDDGTRSEVEEIGAVDPNNPGVLTFEEGMSTFQPLFMPSIVSQASDDAQTPQEGWDDILGYSAARCLSSAA